MIESPDSHVCGPSRIVRFSLLEQSTESSVIIIGQGCKSLLFLLLQFQRPFRPQVVAVYLRHWYPFLIRGWCDLGSACAQSDQSQFYADDFLKFVD